MLARDAAARRAGRALVPSLARPLTKTRTQNADGSTR
jgi:hypothetical protein